MRYQPRLSGGDKFAFVRGARPAERTDRARSSTISAPTDDASEGDAGFASRDQRPRRADEQEDAREDLASADQGEQQHGEDFGHQPAASLSRRISADQPGNARLTNFA